MNSLEKGRVVARNSAIVSFILLLIKGSAGFISGSIVLISDALDSGFDLLTMIASWFGFRISQRKPNEKFPYGYYKVESIISLFISLLIIYAALQLVISGYLRIFLISIINAPLIAGASAVASLIASFLLSRYLKREGRIINSQLLINNSRERLTDSVKSGIVLLTVMLSYYTVPYVEGIVTIIISLLILKVGLESVRDSIIALMDASPSTAIEKRIAGIIINTKGVEGFNNLKLRRAGPFIFGEAVIKVKKFINVKRAHEISDNIEEDIKNKIRSVDNFMVHIEPFKSSLQKIVIPIKNNKGLESEVMNHFGKASSFIFIKIKNNKIKDYYVKENINKSRSVRAGLHTAGLLSKEGIDALITNQLGDISFHTLRDNLIDIYKAKGLRVNEIINNYLSNKLNRLKKPTRSK